MGYLLVEGPRSAAIGRRDNRCGKGGRRHRRGIHRDRVPLGRPERQLFADDGTGVILVNHHFGADVLPLKTGVDHFRQFVHVPNNGPSAGCLIIPQINGVFKTVDGNRHRIPYDGNPSVHIRRPLDPRIKNEIGGVCPQNIVYRDGGAVFCGEA